MGIPLKCLRSILLLFILLNHQAQQTARAFTGTYGINYGRLADNIPSPDKVVKLLRAAKIKNVRIYDSDHSVIKAFTGTGLELVVGLTNGEVKDVSANADHALNWVKDNVNAFLPDTNIVGIAVGNEILAGSDYELSTSLLNAVKNIHNATKKLGISDNIQITTAHSQGVFNNSYPPSSCIFREDVSQLMKPLLEFFSEIGSPFCLNAYPFLAYTYNPDKIHINYALFKSNDGIYDNATHLHYDNLLDAQIDATYAALEDAGFKKMEVIITETGWASRGDQNEPAATADNARTFNYNLRKRLAKRKGTPMRPKHVLKAYIFALFNEDSKPGPTSERNYGLFKADGSISYDIGFHGLEDSSAVSSLLSLKGFRARGLCFSLLATSASLLLLWL
ncbi:PREDICTED: glucan endo-1,3-beta-glucosidase 11-like [Ipomoea nil]|uniref:glucan endo-1,3-beta-glucosidase 11-like n=1 Tax=Ipomoea nil TaxID=35883 RepID=UPI0009016DAE|nr:PREDICTED: glucan endo-1,3-beta-glucosidase 11-like [Ipomoea nil]XP_019189592.1 PREDICTED: glucan endo-1,3-beta-glucosidase 11-like [Ipomoea nil]